LVREAGLYIHAHSVGGINPSLVEAMGLGASVLSLGTPFNREALGEAGRYFDHFDQRLTQQITNLVTEPSEVSDALRAAARQRAASEYRLEDVAEAVEGLLRVASRQPSRRHVAIDTRWSPAVRSPSTRRVSAP
jgi:hypothetical protein